MEGLSTYDYAEQISESMVNGQRKQAREQFRAALADSVNATALLEDISSILGEFRHGDVLRLAGAIINGEV